MDAVNVADTLPTCCLDCRLDQARSVELLFI